ncbi:MAG: permease-like cell division protein FtsX [Proteobacteria bacterium]|nr:permease-like cell division protein FtsX [Pseudomonadota bacterium]
MSSHSQPPSFLLKYLRGHKRALSEGFFMPWKTPLKSLMTLLTLAICFYIPLFLWTLWLNYDELKQSWQNQGSIAVFINGSIDLKEAGILLQEIKDDEVVASARLINADEMRKQLNEDGQLSSFVDLLAANDLPKQIAIKMSDNVTADDVEFFVNQLTVNPQVEYVSYDKQWLQQLNALTRTLLQLARISALMFVLIIMVILGNTIANEITGHKAELRLLELMGATWAQVRRSFLYMGSFFGIYAGIIAVVFLKISFLLLEGTIAGLVKNFGIDIALHGLSSVQILIVIALSILVTWLAARLTLSQHLLNQVND